MYTFDEITKACLNTGALRIVRCRKSVLVFYGSAMTSEAKLLMALMGQPAGRRVFSVRVTRESVAQNMQRTLVIVKPDAVARGLIEEVLLRFQQTGLTLMARRKLTMDKALAEEFYAGHKGQPFFERYVTFMTSGPVLCAVLEGPEAISRARGVLGHYDPAKARHGTIRKDLGIPDDRGILNMAHASDSPEAAKREMLLFRFHIPLA